MTRRLSWLIVVLILLGGARAHAETSLLIVNSPASLLEATERTLRPWEISISSIAEEGRAPSESMPGARDRARQLCEQHEAQALVWLTANADGEALWLYDREFDRVVVRKLNVHSPFDDAEAASVALSIKTLLMHTGAAPPTERFGATPEASSTKIPVPPITSRDSAWFIETGLAVRGGTSGGTTQPRVGLAVVHERKRLALGLGLATGPGYAVDEPAFAGRVVDWAVFADARLSHRWHGLRGSLGTRLRLHRTEISGTIATDGSYVEEARINPSVGLGIGLEKPLGAVTLGLTAHTYYVTRRQRYLVQGATVLELPTTEADVSLYLRMRL